MADSSGRRRRRTFQQAVVLGLVLLVVLGMVAAMVASAAATTATPTTASTATAGTVPDTTPSARATASASQRAGADAATTVTEGQTVTTASGGVPIVVLGTTDLTWADVEAMAAGTSATDEATDAVSPVYTRAAQTLLDLAAHNVPVNVVVRAVGEATCTDDGWLTVSSGRRTRAAALTAQGSCAATGRWEDVVAASRAAGYRATPGLLADTLSAPSRTPAATYTAIGDGAVLALTSSDGTAPTTVDSLDKLVPATMARTGSATPVLPDLTVVDTTPVAGTTAGAKVTGAPTADAGRVLALARAVDEVPAGAQVLVVSVGDSEEPGLQMGVLPAGSTGTGGTESSTFTGPSTHRADLIQLTDLTTTLLQRLRSEYPQTLSGGVITLPTTATSLPTSATGGTSGPGGTPTPESSATSPTTASTAAVTPSATTADGAGTSSSTASVPASVGRLVDDALHARASASATVPAGLLIVAALVACLGHALRRWRLTAPDLGARHAALTEVSTSATGVLALTPAAYLVNLVPWWRVGATADHPSGAATVTALTLMVALAVVTAWAAAWAARRSDATLPSTGPQGPGLRGWLALALAGLTAALVLVDAATGAHLAFNGPLGMNALVAGRFYGVNNIAFSQAGAGIVVVLGALAGLLAARDRPRSAVILAVAAGLAAVALDGTPGLGSDVGGAITLLVALGVLVAGVARWSLTWRRVLGMGIAAVAVVGALAVLDYGRAVADRTHLGRFVADVVAGDALSTITRKAASVVQPFVSSGLAAAALAVGLVLVAGLVWAGQRELARVGADQGPYAWLAQAAPATGWAAGPWVGAAVRALVVLVVVEVLLNDSGLVMACFSAAVALPAALVLVAAALDRGPARLDR